MWLKGFTNYHSRPFKSKCKSCKNYPYDNLVTEMMPSPDFTSLRYLKIVRLASIFPIHSFYLMFHRAIIQDVLLYRPQRTIVITANSIIVIPTISNKQFPHIVISHPAQQKFLRVGYCLVHSNAPQVHIHYCGRRVSTKQMSTEKSFPMKTQFRLTKSKQGKEKLLRLQVH